MDRKSAEKYRIRSHTESRQSGRRFYLRENRKEKTDTSQQFGVHGIGYD